MARGCFLFLFPSFPLSLQSGCWVSTVAPSQLALGAPWSLRRELLFLGGEPWGGWQERPVTVEGGAGELSPRHTGDCCTSPFFPVFLLAVSLFAQTERDKTHSGTKYRVEQHVLPIRENARTGMLPC